jgi:hypothetical protein
MSEVAGALDVNAREDAVCRTRQICSLRFCAQMDIPNSRSVLARRSMTSSSEQKIEALGRSSEMRAHRTKQCIVIVELRRTRTTRLRNLIPPPSRMGPYSTTGVLGAKDTLQRG